jgi:hypothetical protein
MFCLLVVYDVFPPCLAFPAAPWSFDPAHINVSGQGEYRVVRQRRWIRLFDDNTKHGEKASTA